MVFYSLTPKTPRRYLLSCSRPRMRLVGDRMEDIREGFALQVWEERAVFCYTLTSSS
jgi:hypothetical protein